MTQASLASEKSARASHCADQASVTHTHFLAIQPSQGSVEGSLTPHAQSDGSVMQASLAFAQDQAGNTHSLLVEVPQPDENGPRSVLKEYYCSLIKNQ